MSTPTMTRAAPTRTPTNASPTPRAPSPSALRVSKPTDPLEREADRVADRVMRMTTPTVSRSCAACKEDDNEAKVSRAAAGTFDGSISRAELAAPAGGAALPPSVRSWAEPALGADLGSVRVHTGSTADRSAHNVNARAYTLGSDIVFARNQFRPDTPSGQRLLAHELTHALQGSPAIHREVEPEGIETAQSVLGKVDTIGKAYLPGVAGNGKFANAIAEKGTKVVSTAVAHNLARLVALSTKFNPGAPGKAGPTNAFVYSCRCGWLDMGHFFISAVGAYVAAYAQQLQLSWKGQPKTQGELLGMLQDAALPVLRPLLDTVGAGGRGGEILERQRKLLESGEARDISLGTGGYLTEFYQQLGKLFADPMEKVPKWLEGEQRSAFTIEDLPSDCYGADFGQQLFNRVNYVREGLDVSPVHEMLKAKFKECGAVNPQGRTRCEMMAETSPGSCHMEGNTPVYPAHRGTPRQYIDHRTPALLSSAKPLCGDSQPLACQSGTGATTVPPAPAATLDLSKDRARVTLHGDKTVYQPRERGSFGGEHRVPSRVDRLDPAQPFLLSGPTILGVRRDGSFSASSELRTPYQPGGTRILLSGRLTTPTSLAINVSADGPLLDLGGSVELSLDYEGLLKELAAPDVARMKQLFKSKDFQRLYKELTSGKLGFTDFARSAKALLGRHFPEGPKGVVAAAFDRVLDEQLLPLYTRVSGRGTVRAFGVLPISYLTLSKGSGLTPLWGTETGLLTSELLNERVLAGTKIWLYGEKLLQGHAKAGVDLRSRKGFVELNLETQYWGDKRNLRGSYERDVEGRWQFFVVIGGEHDWGSKAPGGK